MLPKQLEANHDLTLQEHREAFEEELGEAVPTSTVGRAIARFLPGGGWPIKKVAHSPRRARTGGGQGPVALALAFRFDARRLVFVDESGFNTWMTRLRARAPRGERAYGKVPRNRGKNITLIAAIALEGGMGESVVTEGATDAEVFEAYVEHFLASTLEEGHVVVLDRLGAQGRRG